MKTNQPTNPGGQRARAAFSVIEVVWSMAIVGVVFVSLYAGISNGFAIIELARENLRGTQIMVEKMETIRLYTWDQITNGGFIPATFEDYYYPSNAAGGNGGIKYRGVTTIGAAPFVNGYSGNIKQVTVDIYWTSAQVPRHRQVRTLVSRYGLQNYIWE